MKTFIGVKILRAEPCNLGDYNKRRGWQIPADEDGTKHGFYLVYPDGYVSWSPAEIFNAAYREISADEKAVVAGVAATQTETFFGRLLAERNELDERLGKLNNFILGEPFRGLDDESRRLLQRQALSMTGYLDILHARIKALEFNTATVNALATDPAPLVDVQAGTGEDDIIETRVTGGGSVETPVPFKGEE